jgi:hypothetical protein
VFRPFANLVSFLYSVGLFDLMSGRFSDVKKFFTTHLYFILKDVMMKTVFALLALFAFAGNAAAELKPNAPKAPKAAGANQFANTGKILEVIDTSMYTYMQVSSDKGPVWLAASKTKVAKGQSISYPNGAVMTNFASKSLNRTFDSIIFLDKVEILKK